ncbi:hypothetical protein ABEB22_08800 [Thioclava sp. 'Guangxiensis']|uniref:hypothetical protein n=1 Tax=Thioclava sp. 'Guangxiensis' TaxID=3149044 RepID=UPI003877A834
MSTSDDFFQKVERTEVIATKLPVSGAMETSHADAESMLSDAARVRDKKRIRTDASFKVLQAEELKNRSEKTARLKAARLARDAAR